jgi:hypothetical protein
MRLVFGATIVGVISLMVFISAQTGFAQLGAQGLVGRMFAVERVDENSCGAYGESGQCGFDAARNAMSSLSKHLKHFNCVTTSGRPRVSLSADYERFSVFDRGPVVTADANDIRCSIDPRAELILVDKNAVAKSCSQLGWKCDVVWVPDYDPTIAFIGVLGTAGGVTDAHP